MSSTWCNAIQIATKSGRFHCLFCRGFEEQGCKAAGVLAIGDMANTMAAMHVARMARRFATTVTILRTARKKSPRHSRKQATIRALRSIVDLSHGWSRDRAHQMWTLNSRMVPIERRDSSCVSLETQLQSMVADPDHLQAHKPKTQINGPFANQLGLHLTSDGNIKTTEPFYSTSVPGVFAAGDCAVPMKAVATAISSGTFVAGGLAGQLQAELYSGQQKLT
ncbi:hypothetical protein N7537_003274 [Penicillium hordei]|uniref:FAD/NAD(P)-binding domain-containing protein n=1 Tax=Penicillium hordei TaxID=40994 RepID=A0AAD6MPI6_9EURO|nr:uncharacterized protein N7537_003274 [Penicillium hordei]KAJ5618160.1 hypothetical protein N7537_003274 [Penicillium hordei]